MSIEPVIHYAAPGYGIIRPPVCGANEGWRKPGEQATFVQITDDPLEATCPICIKMGLPHV